jgi:GTP-binding protein HflX
MLPRLTGKGTSLSRQGGKGAGGAGGAGGGGGRIGVRGPGEKKLETDRRRIRDRVSKIEKQIETVRKQRALRRQARTSVPLGTIALVGYTNAGKSTLFNALSRAEVLVSSRMFATLDPTIRALRLPSGSRVLLSDTVGFIRGLPKGLLNAFRATLEEVQEAALILHVSDIASPHHQELDEAVKKILTDLGVGSRPTLHVWNKIDILPPAEKLELQKSIPHSSTGAVPDTDSESAPNPDSPVLVSAITGEGLDELLRRMDQALPSEPTVKMSLRLPLTEGRTLALVHALGQVLRSQVSDTHMLLEAEVPLTMARRLNLQDFAIRGTF